MSAEASQISNVPCPPCNIGRTPGFKKSTLCERIREGELTPITMIRIAIRGTLLIRHILHDHRSVIIHFIDLHGLRATLDPYAVKVNGGVFAIKLLDHLSRDNDLAGLG